MANVPPLLKEVGDGGAGQKSGGGVHYWIKDAKHEYYKLFS